MHPVFFWLFAVLMLTFGCSVVLQPNPVSSALSLVVSFVALAALFVSLDAFFIGTVQVLVYAGAVMVLFLFIIMLLDLKTERQRHAGVAGVVGGVTVGLVFVAQLAGVLSQYPAGRQTAPPLAHALRGVTSDVNQIGMTIFSDFNLPLQIVGVLVLVATIGVVVLSKRELR